MKQVQPIVWKFFHSGLQCMLCKVEDANLHVKIDHINLHLCRKCSVLSEDEILEGMKNRG